MSQQHFPIFCGSSEVLVLYSSFVCFSAHARMSWILALEYPKQWIESTDYNGSYLTLPERRLLVDRVNDNRYPDIPIIGILRENDADTPLNVRIHNAEQLGAVGSARLAPSGDVYFAADPSSLFEEKPGWEFAAITQLLFGTRGEVTSKKVVAVQYVPLDSIDRWEDNYEH